MCGRAIRQLLSEGVGDPYTRFITPQQFEAMGVYDVTGVGMNLGSTDEYARKVGFDRPTEQLSQEVRPICCCDSSDSKQSIASSQSTPATCESQRLC